MATKIVKSQISDPDTDIGGLSRTQYDAPETAFGVLLADQWSLGDTLEFPLPSKRIISARIVGHGTGTDINVEVLPGTDLSQPLALETEASDSFDLSYVITYTQGAGTVGGLTGTNSGQLLSITIAEAE